MHRVHGIEADERLRSSRPASVQAWLASCLRPEDLQRPGTTRTLICTRSWSGDAWRAVSIGEEATVLRHAVLGICIAACTAAGCTAEEPEFDPSDVSSIEEAAKLAFSREHVVDDIYHYEVVLPVGNTPNAAIRLHRIVREAAPFEPRHTSQAAML